MPEPQDTNEAQASSLAPAVLVVDDDPLIRRLVSFALGRAGYQVTVAAGGLEAMERLSEALPELVVSDVMMPDLDGFELVRRLREDPRTRSLPVLLLTARGSTDDVVRGFGLGADDYLPKPFEMPELLARVRSKIERPPIPSEDLPRDRQTGLLNPGAFLNEVRRETDRIAHGGRTGCLAYLALDELPALSDRLGPRALADVAKQTADVLLQALNSLEILCREPAGRFAVLMPETDPQGAAGKLQRVSRTLMNRVYTVGPERLRFTPTVGYTAIQPGVTAEESREHALAALFHAGAHLDLQPARYTPAMDAAWQAREGSADKNPRWHALAGALRLPAQIAVVLAVALGAPFGAYLFMAAVLLVDPTPVIYLAVVAALALTGLLIWVEGLLALPRRDPPNDPATPYPPATAIIAAYLPNEAATVVDTLEAFLKIDYHYGLQVILAYNTPRDLPIEETLRDLAQKDARLVLLRVPGSTSKAQNVNAALAQARGMFVGVFDADHHPDPDSFTRAWRWLSREWDVVQGHCLVRNGDQSWVARLVAVEFEAIYAVSHPGRARLHNFGIFGGSNGYWKTDLLRQTRMHGFMLTEDIDSSMRVTEEGYRIQSDPRLVSRELAPVTLSALWNQRMRWAQGWFQVSNKHFWRGLTAGRLSLRQKLGLFHLLTWRELYPWISMQMLPIIAFWLIYYGPERVDWFVPIFIATSLFTLSVGPGQALFAYLLSDPQIRGRTNWFLYYLVVASVFYTPLKNLIAVVAQVKEVMGERAWKVTPRTAPDTRP